MLLTQWLNNLTRGFFMSRKNRKSCKERLRTAHYHRPAGIEVLEYRIMLTPTVFIDFGDNFDEDILTGIKTLATRNQFLNDVDIGNTDDDGNPDPSKDITGVKLSDESGNNSNSVKVDIEAVAFTTEERAQILAHTRRVFEPLNINVVLLTASEQTTSDGRMVKGAKTMTDVIDTLRQGPESSKDAYIFAATFVVNPNSATNRKELTRGGLAPVDNIYDSATDRYVFNRQDNVGVVYSGGSATFMNTLSNISHEAGHTFGMSHAVTRSTGTSKVDLLHTSEIMSYLNTADTTSSMFSRYPMIRGDENTPENHESELIFNAAARTIFLPAGSTPFPTSWIKPGANIQITGTACNNDMYVVENATATFITLTSAATLTDEVTVGEATITPLDLPQNYDDLPTIEEGGFATYYDQFQSAFLDNRDYHFISGTGAYDKITISRNGGRADVTIEAFGDANYTDAIDVPGDTPGTRYTYSIPLSRNILVQAGDSDDRIEIHGDLGVDVLIDGMLGVDSLIINGQGASNASYTPNSTILDSVDLKSSAAGFVPVDDYGGQVSLGNMNVSFRNFEATSPSSMVPTSTVTIQGVSSINVNGTPGRDFLKLDASGAVAMVSGSVNGPGSTSGIVMVPLMINDASNVNLNVDLKGGDNRFDLYAIPTIGDINLVGGTGVDEFNVYGVGNGTELRLQGGSGGDFYTIGGGDYDTNIGGAVSILDVAGFDTLTIKNQFDNFGFHSYTLEKNSSGIDQFSVFSAPDAPLTFSGINSVTIDGSDNEGEYYIINSLGSLGGGTLTINGGDGGDTFNINDTDAHVVFNGNGGSDTFNIGNGDFLQNINAGVTIEGGSGDDVLTIDDHEAETGFRLVSVFPVDVRDAYTLTRNSFQKTSFVTIAGSKQPPTLSPLLTFDAIANLNLLGSNSTEFLNTTGEPESVYNIHGVAGGTTLTIHGNEGDDEFVVLGVRDSYLDSNPEDPKGDYDSNIFGSIIIDGGDDEDVVRVDDRNDDGNDTYYFTSRGFSKSSSGTRSLSISDVDTFTLLGNDKDNHFDVNDTVQGTDYVLKGEGGDDEFDIDVDGLRSDISVGGGSQSTATGDSLVVRNGRDASAIYEPDGFFNGAGVISDIVNFYRNNTITFFGLEPVELRNFAEVTLVTPRSTDIVAINPTEAGGLSISGTSDNQQLGFPAPSIASGFESLITFNVGKVTLDTGTNDDRTVIFPPYAYPPTQNVSNQVTIHAGALQAAGLNELCIQTGLRESYVYDYTLEGVDDPDNPPPLAHVTIEGSESNTHVEIYGTAELGEFEQLPGHITRINLQNRAGASYHQLELNNVATVLLPDAWENTRAVGFNVNRRFGTIETQSGPLQTITGTDLTEVRVKPRADGNHLEILAQGTSGIEIGGFAFDGTVISAGPQPEPPRQLTLRVTDVYASEHPMTFFPIRDFGPVDTITIEGFVPMDGPARPTDYSGMFEATRGIVELTSDIGAIVDFDVELPDEGTSPLLVFAGRDGLANSGQFAYGDISSTRAVLWQTKTRNLASLELMGTARDDMFRVGALDTGGLVGTIMPLERDATFEVRLSTDSVTSQIKTVGGGGLDSNDIAYPEPDFRPVNIDLQGVEKVTTNPVALDLGPLMPVRQILKPTSGEISTGSFLVTHDGALTTSRIEAMSVELRVTPDITDTFSRDLSLGYRYLGSKGTYVVNGHFEGDFEITVEHKEGADNLSVFQYKDAKFDKSNKLLVEGTDQGKDKVLVTSSGVECQQGSEENLKLKAGDDYVVITESNNGQPTGTTDKTLVEGDGTGAEGLARKTIVTQIDVGKTPAEQLADLERKLPAEVALQVKELADQADQMTLNEQGSPKTPAGTKQLVYEGVKTAVEFYLFNGDNQPLKTSVQNTDGTIALEKEGNIEVTFPALDGTGITPDGIFQILSVTNTMDSGPGSLRDAIERANALGGSELAVISFAIPPSDPGFVDVDSHLAGGDPDPDVFVIHPLTELPALIRGNTVINGQSQQSARVTETGATAFRFTGRITSVDAPLAGSFAVDAPLEVNVEFDPNFADTEPDPHHGRYFSVPIDPADYGAISQLTATIGSYAAQSIDGVMQVYNDFENQAGLTLDGFNLGATVIHGLTGASLGDYDLQAIDVNLVDFTHTAFSDDLLKTSLDLTAFPDPNLRQFNLLFRGAGQTFAFARGEITGIESIAGSTPGETTTRLGDTNPFGPEIVLNGGAIISDADGLHLDSEGNRIHGLTIQQFMNNGILVTGNENELTGNYVGTTTDGMGALANGGNGVSIQDSDRNVIGGAEVPARNVISGNGGEGILVHGNSSNANQIQGNYIGVNAAGTAAIGNHLSGIFVPGPTNTHILDNVVSGNLGFAGIAIYGGNPTAGDASGTVIQGNYVGTNAAGNAAIPNLGEGISINDTVGSYIGGPNPQDRNVISGNLGEGIEIFGSLSDHNTVQGNHIGVNAAGMAAIGNHLSGIFVPGSTNTHILDNVVSGNLGFAGISIYGGNPTLGDASGTVIQGNYVGTNAAGDFPIPNLGEGISLNETDGSLIGGASIAARNIVSANVGPGISIIAGVENAILGNYIGPAVDGRRDLGSLTGIRLNGGLNHRIGGNSLGEGNLISSNFNGIEVYGTVGTTIQGNLIGTDSTGTMAEPNFSSGVIAVNALDLLIGGSEPAAGNLISGNLIGLAIEVSPGMESHGVRVLGNQIGTTIDGAGAIPNNIGVFIAAVGPDRIRDVCIGGTQPGEANEIAHNRGEGILIKAEGSSAVSIRGNSIHSNGELGIDLGDDGVTLNDDLDSDLGPNGLQNFPVIRQARITAQDIQVRGQLHSTPNSQFIVDLYASSEPDSTGYGEGQRWLASAVVTTHDDGVASIRLDLPLDAAAAGEYITATATLLVDHDSNPDTPLVPFSTSEFSLARPLAQNGAGGGGNGGRPTAATVDSTSPLLVSLPPEQIASATSEPTSNVIGRNTNQTQRVTQPAPSTKQKTGGNDRQPATHEPLLPSATVSPGPIDLVFVEFESLLSEALPTT